MSTPPTHVILPTNRRATIRVNGQRLNLGTFPTTRAAALAYDQATRPTTFPRVPSGRGSTSPPSPPIPNRATQPPPTIHP